MRTKRSVRFSEVPESELQYQFFLRMLRIRPDQRIGVVFSMGQEASHGAVVSLPVNNAAIVDGEINYRDDFRRIWESGHIQKRVVQEFAKLESRNIVKRLLSVVKAKK